MKTISILLLTSVLMLSGYSKLSANEKTNSFMYIIELAENIDEFDKESAKMLKSEIKTLSVRERVKLAKYAIKEAKKAKKTGNTEVAKPVLYVLAVFIPPVAVGLYTNWEMPTLWNLCWTCLFGFPGIIHAFYIIL